MQGIHGHMSMTFIMQSRNADFENRILQYFTHWHYAHTLGLRAISGVSVAHEKTNAYLKEEQKKAKNENYIDILKKEDAYFAKEYENSNKLEIELPDMEFTKDFQLDLGRCRCIYFSFCFTTYG